MSHAEFRDRRLPEERQRLFDIAARGLDLIKSYQKREDPEVLGTAMHFTKYFEDIERIAKSIMNPLTEDQKQQLRTIQHDALEKIQGYVAETSHNTEVHSTAMHFTRFFEKELNNVIEQS